MANTFSIAQEFDNQPVKKVYIEILSNLGIESPEEILQQMIEKDNIKDGNCLNRYIQSLFMDKDTFAKVQQAKSQKEWDDLVGDKATEITQKRQQKAEKILNSLGNDVSPYAKAYFTEMAGEYIPFDTVLTAGIKVGEGQSLQMGCGEGKSGVVSLAANKLLSEKEENGKKKNQVFITSSTDELADDSFKDKMDFYVKSGLARSLVYVKKDEIVYPVIDENGKRVEPNKEIKLSELGQEERKAAIKEALSCDIVIATNTTLMQLAMEGEFKETPENGVSRHILADEADFVALDQYRPMQRTQPLNQEESNRRQNVRFEAYDILQEVLAQGQDLYDIDDENQYVDFNDKGKALVVKTINARYATNADIDKNELYDYVYDALAVETIYKEDRDYQLLDLDKQGKAEVLVSEDRASGSDIDLPEGIKQALQIKLTREGKYEGEISEEREVLDLLDAKSFLTKYFSPQGKRFISGTLGLDSKEVVAELDEDFHVTKEDIYEIPPREEAHREEQGKFLHKDGDSKRQAIAENAKTELGKGRPVLIGTVSETELKKLRQTIDQEYKDAQADKKPLIYEYTAASEKIFQDDKKRLSDKEFEDKYRAKKEKYETYKKLLKITMKDKGGENVIIIGTSILGRGLTLKTDKVTKKRGGIHVIIDGLHETSSRNQGQFKARTARGTDPGSVIEMFSIEDIPKEYRDGISESTNPEEAYEKFYKRVDTRTASVRRYVKEFVEITESQLEQVDETPGLSDNERKEIKALITARSFQIKTRACGISDKFKGRTEQYKKEIEAYRAMYISKYKDERNGQPFDETKWLKDKGFGDIADTYIPFSKERESKIFTLAGIKKQAGESKTKDVQGQSKATRDYSQNREQPGQQMGQETVIQTADRDTDD